MRGSVVLIDLDGVGELDDGLLLLAFGSIVLTTLQILRLPHVRIARATLQQTRSRSSRSTALNTESFPDSVAFSSYFPSILVMSFARLRAPQSLWLSYLFSQKPCNPTTTPALTCWGWLVGNKSRQHGDKMIRQTGEPASAPSPATQLGSSGVTRRINAPSVRFQRIASAIM